MTQVIRQAPLLAELSLWHAYNFFLKCPFVSISENAGLSLVPFSPVHDITMAHRVDVLDAH